MTAKLHSPATSLKKPPVHALPNEQQRILVVDDEPSLRQLNRAALMNNGYRVDTATDGQAGWERIQASSYDLLITDFNMPRMTGLQLIEKVHVNNIVLPVVLVTADYPLVLLEQQSNLPIEATLLKPYTLEQLLTVVKNVLYSNVLESLDFSPPPRRQNLPTPWRAL